MGDPACWLDRVCAGCDRVADDLDDLEGQRRCAACAAVGPGEDEGDGDP
jgi:hypothetical protein